MTKIRKTLTIVLSASAILGILVVSGHAKKPSPPPEPTVAVTGVITAENNPEAINVMFDDSLSYDYPGDATDGLEFISNPDYPPSLKIINSAPPAKHLRYYYCVHKDHEGSGETLCNDTSHSPYYYYCLTIKDGITQKKSPRDINHVVFPEGYPWSISWKYDNSIVAEGILSTETTYDVIE